MSKVAEFKTPSQTTTLYLVNDPHVDGRVVYNAMIDVLKMKESVAQKMLMQAHTKGLIELSDVTIGQAKAIVMLFNAYMQEEGYLQKVLVEKSDLALVKIQAQHKNDLVRRLVELPEEVFLNANNQMLIK